MEAIKFLRDKCGFGCGDPYSEISRAWAEIEAMLKAAERYRRLRHKMTCGHFTKEEELAVLGARDAASFDAVMDAMEGANA